jgi:hypothetical protein
MQITTEGVSEVNHKEVKASLKYIVETQNKQIVHLESINSRVRSNERSISAIQGVGTTVALFFTTIIGFLFKRG